MPSSATSTAPSARWSRKEGPRVGRNGAAGGKQGDTEDALSLQANEVLDEEGAATAATARIAPVLESTAAAGGPEEQEVWELRELRVMLPDAASAEAAGQPELWHHQIAARPAPAAPAPPLPALEAPGGLVRAFGDLIGEPRALWPTRTHPAAPMEQQQLGQMTMEVPPSEEAASKTTVRRSSRLKQRMRRGGALPRGSRRGQRGVTQARHTGSTTEETMKETKKERKEMKTKRKASTVDAPKTLEAPRATKQQRRYIGTSQSAAPMLVTQAERTLLLTMRGGGYCRTAAALGPGMAAGQLSKDAARPSQKWRLGTCAKRSGPGTVRGVWITLTPTGSCFRFREHSSTSESLARATAGPSPSSARRVLRVVLP